MSPSAHENTDVKGDRKALVLWDEKGAAGMELTMREHALFQQSRLPCGVFVRLILVAFAWPCLLPHSNHDWLVQNNPCPGNRKNGGAGETRTLDPQFIRLPLSPTELLRFKLLYSII